MKYIWREKNIMGAKKKIIYIYIYIKGKTEEKYV